MNTVTKSAAPKVNLDHAAEGFLSAVNENAVQEQPEKLSRFDAALERFNELTLGDASMNALGLVAGVGVVVVAIHSLALLFQ